VFDKNHDCIDSIGIHLGEPRMGKMVHGNVHENDYQVTVEAVFSKPGYLSQSAFYIDETLGNYGLNSERSSTFSSVVNSDGNRFHVYHVE
jgi:hypothetical protein